MSSNVAVCWEWRAMKAESSLRLTSLSALLVIFVSQRLHALGKIIAYQLENPCASWLNDVNSHWEKRPSQSAVT
jgi:hypothetical protein